MNRWYFFMYSRPVTDAVRRISLLQPICSVDYCHVMPGSSRTLITFSTSLKRGFVKKSAEQPLSLSLRETMRNKYRPTKKRTLLSEKCHGRIHGTEPHALYPDDAPDRAPRLLPHSDKPRETASYLGTVYKGTHATCEPTCGRVGDEADVAREFTKQLEAFLSWICGQRSTGSGQCPCRDRPTKQ